jgi:copper chaperone CopZ
MVEPVYCVHCGAIAKHPVTKMIDGQTLNFCCGGCLQVYEMLHEEGLASEPVEVKTKTGSKPESSHDQSEPAQTITLPIMGMTCTNCVATVERGLLSVPGVLDVNVVLKTEQATIKIIPSMVSITDLKHAVKNAGYEVPFEGDINVSALKI